MVFEERDGLIAVEAEHFFRQTADETRRWYLTTAAFAPAILPDGDPPHVAGASGGAYLEILPDTRRTHGDKLIEGENFSDEPGKIGLLSYRVHINTPGRYYVWGRIFSTTSEDNSLHVGIDDTWPESGRRMQWITKGKWVWGSKQRTKENHNGEPYMLFLDIENPGPHTISFCMREDGLSFDRWLMTTDREFKDPGDGPGPESRVKEGALPPPFPAVEAAAKPAQVESRGGGVEPPADALRMAAVDFPAAGTQYYVDQKKWLAVNPARHKEASVAMPFPHESGTYTVVLQAVGENDGCSKYEVSIAGKPVGTFTCPLAFDTFEEGPAYNVAWPKLTIQKGDEVRVRAVVGSEDGTEFSRARWSALLFTKGDVQTVPAARAESAPAPTPAQAKADGPRGADGDGRVKLEGELRQWHKVTLSMAGPFAAEKDNEPNPFTDYRMTVRFTHESGQPAYEVPGYFAADGRAAESSADRGNVWRAHLSPDKAGRWTYEVAFAKGSHIALDPKAAGEALKPFDGQKGTFEVQTTDKTGRDFRARGRLQYVGKHHLRFAGSGEYFLKAGADAPESLLAYADFDDTWSRRKKGTVPREGEAAAEGLHRYEPHVRDWKAGDPTWKGGKGKGLIGALNYLSGKGCNVFSFLSYNVGGDGDNVWPFVAFDDKFHYDCSKLDQWGIVFDHATRLGLYLHFKLQETEMDDKVPSSLDKGDLGPERRLYCRELIARFGHALALNWNLGEENSQTPEQQRAMARYIRDVDPYDHHIVIHTFPDQQEKVYRPLLGDQSVLTGASLQNGWNQVHQCTLKWVTESAKAGKPWVVANDEQGGANTGVPPDPGYQGYEGKDAKGKPVQTIDDIRKLTLWGNLMAGGAGVEYYFGYQLPQNDLNCEDWRSRDKSWDYGRIALEFFKDREIPFWEMTNADALIGNAKSDNSRYCLAKAGELYLVYLPNGGESELDLTGVAGSFTVAWFDPRTGGPLLQGALAQVAGGAKVALGAPPREPALDWLVVVRRAP